MAVTPCTSREMPRPATIEYSVSSRLTLSIDRESPFVVPVRHGFAFPGLSSLRATP